MKNKVTTALMTSMFAMGLISSANSQTTISGNLDLAYHAVSSNAATGGSYRAIGRETQINIANKGKLSNGMDYAAGFSWELDGGEQLGVSTSADSDSANSANENVYIDFYYNKDSYISISNDHVQNTDVTFTNLVGWGYLGGQGINNKTSLYPTSLNESGYGIGVSHALPGFRIAGTFVPNPNKDGATTNETGHTLTNAADTNTNSRIELTGRGDLGVKGLDVMIGYAQKDKSGADTVATGKDYKGHRASAKYNFGQITIAGDYIKSEGNNINYQTSATVSGNHELTGKSVGVAYAITPALSVGYTRSEAKTNQAAALSLTDEKVNMYAVGYNLGPVTVQAQYRDAEGVVGNTGANGEGEILAVKFSTKF
jgi:hypothetical protein